MIVLTGASGSGKSTLIGRLLDRLDGVSGYRTKCHMQAGKSFYLLPIQADNKGMHTNEINTPFMVVDDTGVRFDFDRFIGVAKGSVKKGCKLIILDEVGGVELLSDQTFAWLLALKAGDTPLLVVYKSDLNCLRLIEKAALSRDQASLLLTRRESLLEGVDDLFDVSDQAELIDTVEALLR